MEYLIYLFKVPQFITNYYKQLKKIDIYMLRFCLCIVGIGCRYNKLKWPW